MRRMSVATFDTFKFVERLERAGVPREHAAAIAEAQRDAMAETLSSELTTRGDLAAAKADLKADVVAVRSDLEGLRKDLQALELRLTVKLGAFVVAAVGVLIAVLKLPH